MNCNSASPIQKLRVLVPLALILGISWTGSAQVVGGSISGTVRDQSGAQLPGATVTIHNIETGAERTLTSDDEGRYAAPSVPVGRYTVGGTKTGFSTQEKTGVSLVVGQSTVVDLTLPVGAIQQEVMVSLDPPSINTTTQQISGLVDEKQVKELPLNGRSYDELITLNPAVVNYTNQRAGGVGTSNSSVGNMFSVTGHRPQENLFLLNGIEYTGASLINVTPGGTSGQLLGVDAVREFNVVTDTYGAEYGKRPGAQVSIVTASGTNVLHGSVYEFIRNSALDARNYFDQGNIPIFQRNEFGGALGGPVVRDKVLLFGNYEGYRQNLGLSDVTYVPDADSRAKAVSGVQPLLALWPEANGPEVLNTDGTNSGIAIAYSHPLQRIREDFGTTRADYNISTKDSAFAAYTVDDSYANSPSINPLSSIVEGLREQVVSAQEQHIFSSALLNTARVGYSRASYYFNGVVPGGLPGWIGGNPIGAIVIGGSTASNGASQITAAGTNTGSLNHTARNLFTYDDHVYWTHRNHQVEAGVWIQRIQSNDDLAQFQNGQASFSSLSNFLKGNLKSFQAVPSPTELGWRSLESAGFVQDTIHLRKNLEVRLGFRFEGTDGWNEAKSRASNYLFSNGVIQTDPVVGGSAFTKNRAKFLPEPRVGLAWDPTGGGKTVIHSGFGIYHALLDTLDYRLDQTAPYNTTLTLAPATGKTLSIEGLHWTPGAAPPAGSKVGPSSVQPDLYTPTLISWSLNVERQIAPFTTLTLGYAGSHGYHSILSADLNEPTPVICPNPSVAGCSNLTAGTIYYPAGSPLANPALSNTTSWISGGISSYHALVADVNHRFQHGLQLRGVYTFSKGLDDGSAWNTSVGSNSPAFVMYPAQPKLDYGRSNVDVRHNASINGTYELPFGNGKLFFGDASGWQQKAAGGWTLSSILTLQSGLPFTPQLGFNPSNTGDTRNPVRPSWNPSFTGKVIQGGALQYFNPNAFLIPGCSTVNCTSSQYLSGTYGNVRRNSLTGPDSSELDVSMRKDTAVTERLNVQFRAEFFNILNHTNFSTPNPVVYGAAPTAASGSTAAVPAAISPTAGLINATATTSRQIQFGLKLLF